MAFLQNAAGAVPSPFDSWLDIRGLKTLDLRVRKHSANALEIAQWLESRPEIERVWYPGLESHPGHEIAARQMHGGFGGMISVQLAGGPEAAQRFTSSTRLFTLAESLGGVESLIEVPAARPMPRFQARHSRFPPTSCACPSASKMPAISLPTWSRHCSSSETV